MRERRGRPMFFLDLAMPRDIEPDVRDVYNVFAYSIDDLEEVANENRAPAGAGGPGRRKRSSRRSWRTISAGSATCPSCRP